jgi:hypothetical protein
MNEPDKALANRSTRCIQQDLQVVIQQSLSIFSWQRMHKQVSYKRQNILVGHQMKISKFPVLLVRSTVYHGSPLRGAVGGWLPGQVKQCNNKRYKIQFNKV